MQKSDEKIYNWIGMLNSSKKESKEVKVKQEKKDDNFESKESKKVTTGEKFQNFAINDVSYRDDTREFEYKIQFFLEKKALHIRKRVQGKGRITFKHGYCEKIRASNEDKTMLSLFVTPFDQNKTFDRGQVAPILEKILNDKPQDWLKLPGKYTDHWKTDHWKDKREKASEKREPARGSQDKFVPRNAKEKSKETWTRTIKTSREEETSRLRKRSSYYYGKDPGSVRERSPDHGTEKLPKKRNETVAKLKSNHEETPRKQVRLVKAKGSVATEERDISPTIEKTDKVGNRKEKVRQKDLKIAKLTKQIEKERVDTEAYEYYTTEDEEPDESFDKKQNESIDEKPRESDDDYHDYTSSGDDKAPTSRAHWTPQQEDPKREIWEAREEYGRKQMKKRKEKDEKELITTWAWKPKVVRRKMESQTWMYSPHRRRRST